MPAMRVVPAFEKVEDREGRVVMRLEAVSLSSSHSSVAKKLSHLALS